MYLQALTAIASTEEPGDSEPFGFIESQGSPLLGPAGFVFDAAFLGILAVIILGILSVTFMIVRNYKAARRAGMNPLTMQTDLAAKAMNSQLLAPERSKEERLAELDSLFSRGTISHAEHATARASILAEK